MHCMVATKLGTYSTGGYHNASTYISGVKETWFLAKNSYSWESRPNLMFARKEHPCALFAFSNTEVLIVAGGNSEGKALRSTELLILGDDENGWQPGPLLPEFVYMRSDTIVSNGESLYLLYSLGNVFYELRCIESLTNCRWEPLHNVKLRYPRHWGIALMLPDHMVDMVDCTSTTSMTTSSTASTSTSMQQHKCKLSMLP